MELYEITLHFPNTYGSLGNEELTLKSVEYYESEEEAISRAKTIATAFVTPRPDYWYMTDASERNVWTDSPQEVKKALHYDIIASKPNIYTVSN